MSRPIRNQGRETQPVSTVWSSTQAYTLAVVCLLLGAAVGYLLRGSEPAAVTPAQAATTQSPNVGPAQIPGFGGVPGAAQSRELVDKAAEPMVAAIKANPKDTATLAKLGNLYYDAQLYKDAIQYYQQALKITPGNPDVRTDMATAMFYLGDADAALGEFQKSLSYRPNHPQTLFNMGIVKWQGKNDAKGALAAWEQLLKANPDYPERQKVEDLMNRAKEHAKG
ncbi:MAG: tetratricopeptide repeat protein [Terriglobales bacterium]